MEDTKNTNGDELITKPKTFSERFFQIFQQIFKSELDHQYYSKSWAWIIAALLVAAVPVGMTTMQDDSEVICGGKKLSIMQLQLALSNERIEKLLQNPQNYNKEDSETIAIDRERCVAQYRQLLGIDSALFIPMYIILGATALFWYGCLALRENNHEMQKWQQRISNYLQKKDNLEIKQLCPPPHFRMLSLVALISIILLLTTSYFDGEENKATHKLLDAAVGHISLSQMPNVEDERKSMRDASILKWAVSSMWVATLAWIAVLRRRSLSGQRPTSDNYSKLSKLKQFCHKHTGILLIVSSGVPALLIMIGTLVAYADSTNLNSYAICSISIGFLALFLHPACLLVAHWVNTPKKEKTNHHKGL